MRSGWLLAGALMALLLAAVLLLPLLELAPSTTRSTMGFEETAVSSVPPRYLWGLLLADHRGWMDYVLYVGVPVLGLALIALRRRRARGWGTFALLALVVSLGTHTPLYPLAFRLLPILRWLRAPSRIWFVVAAALALMAGWGTDEVLSGWRARSRRWMNRIALAAAALGPGLVLGYAVGFERPPNNLIAFGLVVPLTAGLFAAAADERLPRRLLVGGLIGVLLADLWIVGGTMIEGRPAHAVFEDTALAQYLSTQQEDEPSRIYSPSYSLPRHVAARYGLETADGVDPLHLERYAAWMEAASGVKRKGYTETVPPLENGGDIHEVNRDARPDPHMLGLLNVRYVAAEFPVQVEGLRQIRRFGGTFLYENKQVLPRAFVVGRVEAMPDFDSALAWVQSHDVSRAAAVEGGKALDSGEVTAEIEWIRRSPSRLLLDVTVDRSAFLVLSEAWYPGWRGDVDGRSVELWRADGVLSGIYLGPGHHRVDLEYRPGRTLIGAALSLATAILVGAVIWTRRSDSEGYRDGQT